ncbi:non-specific serine/threonine protein kinase [Ranunculus cassubicifolius]
MDQTKLYFVAVISLAFITVGLATDYCNRVCSANGGKRIEVQYPFGFSENCGIRLNCTQGRAQIGDFEVKVTAQSIIVPVPSKCNRSIELLKPLFGHNFAPTLRNGLLVQNCISPPTRCVIPADLIGSLFKKGCDQPYCYSKKRNDSDYMRFSDVQNSGCTNVLSSVSVAFDSANKNMSLNLETIQLGWWLEGECNCSSNAKCRNITSPVDGKRSFRCWCADGHYGDGFAAGAGCTRRVYSRCSALGYLKGGCGGKARLVVLIGCFFAGACLVIGLAFLCYVIRQRTIASRSRESTRKLLSEAALVFTVPFFSYKEIERATFCFAEKYRLGTGAYGTVYAGKLHNEEWVAIKKIRHRDREGMDSIMNEIKLISSVNHPNLVHLLGFCLEKDEQILVYEFMPNGTLSQHLQRERGTGLPWTIRLNIATETAHAIAYLHSMDPPIYHRDIKSSNILLDTNLNSKVADFGLSRIGMPESSHISTAPQGTPGYLDPQYHQNFHLSDKSDVYSFGVVLVEIITAMKVVDFSRSQTEVNLAALALEKIGKGCLEEIIDPFLEPGRDAWTLSSIHKMGELAFRCLAFHKDVRPSMTEVAAELEQIKLSGWAPLEASCYSSPSKGSMNSQISIAKKETVEKTALGSQRVISTQVKDWSPISVNEPWLSEQSSPSTNSFGKPGTHQRDNPLFL